MTPPSGKWRALVAVGVGAFMSALDGSIVNTILPVVQGALATDVATIEWVVTVYLLVVSGVLLTFGRFGDLYGHRRVYASGVVVFVLASALCGLAATAAALVAFRGLQALGAAMLFANGPAIVTRNFSPEERGRALGLYAGLVYLGLTMGPSLGGWLTAAWSWRAVFYVNVPVGLAALLLTLGVVPHAAPAATDERFDVWGGLTFTVGLVALLLALNRGHAWGWRSGAIAALVALAAALLVGFVVIERRVAHPMLDLTLFERRVFSAAAASAVLNYMSVFSIVFLAPFYLIQARGLSPAHTGVVLTAQPLVMTVAAPLAGALSDRIGARAPATIGMTVLAVGLFLLSRLDGRSTLGDVVLGLGIAGLGTGLFTSPNNSALMGAAPPDRQGVAAGVLATARNVGMVLGIGVAGAVFTTVLARGAGAGIETAVATGFVVAALTALAGAVTSATR